MIPIPDNLKDPTTIAPTAEKPTVEAPNNGTKWDNGRCNVTYLKS